MKFKLENMTCGHCVQAITQVLTEHDSNVEIEINLPEKLLKLDSTLSIDQIQALLNEEGYSSTFLE